MVEVQKDALKMKVYNGAKPRMERNRTADPLSLESKPSPTQLPTQQIQTLLKSKQKGPFLQNQPSNMPAERQSAQKRRRLPFNPPRPRASPGEGPSTSAPKSAAKEKTTTTSATKPKPKRKSTTAAASSSRKKSPPPPAESPSPSASASGSEADSDDANARNRKHGPSEEPEYILAEIMHGKPSEDVTSSEPAIPGKLLTRLLHHNFQNEKTKVAKDANEVVAKYVDVFVREALARATYERAEGGDGGGAIGDGFLEVCLSSFSMVMFDVRLLTDMLCGRSKILRRWHRSLFWIFSLLSRRLGIGKALGVTWRFRDIPV